MRLVREAYLRSHGAYIGVTASDTEGAGVIPWV